MNTSTSFPSAPTVALRFACTHNSTAPVCVQHLPTWGLLKVHLLVHWKYVYAKPKTGQLNCMSELHACRCHDFARMRSAAPRLSIDSLIEEGESLVLFRRPPSEALLQVLRLSSTKNAFFDMHRGSLSNKPSITNNNKVHRAAKRPLEALYPTNTNTGTNDTTSHSFVDNKDMDSILAQSRIEWFGDSNEKGIVADGQSRFKAALFSAFNGCAPVGSATFPMQTDKNTPKNKSFVNKHKTAERAGTQEGSLPFSQLIARPSAKKIAERIALLEFA